MNKRLLATLISGLLVTFAAATAVAEECESDSDCDEGYTCELPGFACAEGPNGEGHDECIEEMENLTGECVRGPLECETDADCPGILTCESWGSSSDAPCAIDEEGNTDCPEPEPQEEEFFCDWRPADCDEDTACAEGFECVSNGGGDDVGCAEACDSEGNCTSDCPDGAPEDPDGGFREEETSGYCFPIEIECETDSQCPSDWSCYTLEYTQCSGGGSTGNGGSTDPDEGGRGGQEEDEAPPFEEECETVEESRCIPPGFDQLIEQGFGGGGVAESGDNGGLFGDPRADSDLDGDGQNTGGNGEKGGDGGSSDSDSGCGVPVGVPNAAPAALIAMAGLLLLRR